MGYVTIVRPADARWESSHLNLEKRQIYEEDFLTGALTFSREKEPAYNDPTG